MSQFDDLVFALHVGNFDRLADDPVDDTPDPADPMTKFVARREFDAALVKAGGDANDRAWDELLAGDALAKRVSRTEEKLAASGDVWRYSYGSANDLIAAQVVDQDGGELAKCADGEERDLTKASSGRGKIRLKKTFIDGQEWILGFDFEGRNTYSRPADQQTGWED